jgi:hypothetical protein
MVFAGGHISGGHYNPAVTRGKQSMDEDAIAPVLDERRYRIRYIQSGDGQAETAKSLDGNK